MLNQVVACLCVLCMFHTYAVCFYFTFAISYLVMELKCQKNLPLLMKYFFFNRLNAFKLDQLISFHSGQLVINTAIVYMHRFYMKHSFRKFHRNLMAPACLFLATKIEEEPRRMKDLIEVAHCFLYKGTMMPPIDSEVRIQNIV